MLIDELKTLPESEQIRLLAESFPAHVLDYAADLRLANDGRAEESERRRSISALVTETVERAKTGRQRMIDDLERLNGYPSNPRKQSVTRPATPEETMNSTKEKFKLLTGKEV
ncbi:MAG: hypothetical protein KDJ52_01325 [Anaerolineae bacterium]|nr:hypothetical protein [Anaerolineae bacterium]